MRDFVIGTRAFREPRRFALALGVSTVAWLVDLVAIGSTLSALDIHLRVGDLIVLLIAVNVALVLPSGPANIGSLELGATLGAQYLGIAHSRAVAFALVYHAAQLAPLIVLGAFGFIRAAVEATSGETSSHAPRAGMDVPPISSGSS